MAAVDYASVVQQLYISYFGRPADYYGLQSFETQLNNIGAPTTFAGVVAAIQDGKHQSLVNLVNSFNNSQESINLYGSDNTTVGISKFVQAVYENVLGREPDLAGASWWINEIVSGRLAKASAAAAIAQGALSNTTTQGLVDAQTVQKKLAVATDFTNSLDSLQKINAFSGDAAALAARNLLKTVSAGTDLTAAHNDVLNVQNTLVNPITNNVLTTGNDTITRATTVTADLTSFNYNGKGPSLNAGDSISNVTNLQISDQAAQGVDLLPTGVTLSNVQNIALTTNGNAGSGGAAWDTTSVSGVASSTVTSSGAGNDLVAAAQTTTITVNHNNPGAGTVTTIGGSDVNVVTSGGAVIVGKPTAAATAPLANQIAAGNVTVTQNGTGANGVRVSGGTNVTVSTTSSANSGAILIGNTAGNTGNSVAGAVANATGVITVNNAGTGAINVFGGTDVNISDTALQGAGAIVVGDITARTASNFATGNITVTESAANTFDGQSGAAHNNLVAGSISVYGGASVTINSNAGGNIIVGDNAAKGTTTKGNVAVNATGIYSNVLVDGGAAVTVSTAGGSVVIGQTAGTGTPAAADNPTGAVAVTETVTGFFNSSAITVNGGTSVAVTANGTNATIGTTVAPTGNVTVGQASVFTGSGYASGNGAVVVGGGAAVTVNTTGGDVTVGVNNQSAATGAVAITNTFSGPQTSADTVLGGTTVNVTTTATSGAINVGSPLVPALGADGASLKNASQYATGNVTIVNATTNGTKVAYGTGTVNVATHGGSTVSVTGGSVGTIVDTNTLVASSGAGAGKPIGNSSLTTVVLNANQSAAVQLTSNALNNVTITNGAANATYTINNATAAHDLTLTLGGQSKTTNVVDVNAGTVTVNSTAANTGAITLTAANATKATFNNAAASTFVLTADTNLTSIVATNAGSANLGDVSSLAKLATIDATKSTGGVTVTVNGAVTTFNGAGGSGNDTVTLTGNSLLHADGTTFSDIIGGSGSNTIIANYAATLGDQALGNTAHIKNFGTLGLGANASTNAAGIYAGGNTFYDASGFSALTLGQTAGDVTFKNVAAGASLSITAPNTHVVNYLLSTDTKADTLSLNAGTTGSTAGAYTVATTGIETLAVNSNAKSGTNTIVIDDTAAKTIKLTGTQGVTLTVKSDAGAALTGLTSNVTTIDASGTSGAVDVSGVVLNSSVASTAHTIIGGSGVLTATGSGSNTAIDTITTGSGGGVITLGAAGSFDNDVAAAGNTTPLVYNGSNTYTTGSQVVDLTASTAKADKIVANDGAVATNNGVRGGITGFQSGVANADTLQFQATKSVVANVAAATVVNSLTGAATMAGVLDQTGALATALANMTYTVSNGVITFGAVGGHNVNEFTIGQFISAAEIIANAAGANKVVGFSYQGNTYVVASDAGNTLATDESVGGTVGNAGDLKNDMDTLITLNGVGGFSGFGTTGAAGALVANVTNADSGAANTGSASAALYDETGFAAQTISTFGTSTTAITKLAASGTLTFTGGAAIGAVTIAQTATAGNNSLTLNLNNASTYDSITVNGDDNALLNVNANSTIKVLGDAANTLKTVTLAGAGNATILAVSDTALKTIDASGLTGTLTLGTSTATIANDGLTIKLAGGAASTVYANGNADVVTQGSGAGAVTLVANGAGDSITLSNGANNVTALGANDTIKLGTGINTVLASGSNLALTVDFNTGASVYTVGKNAVVNFTHSAGDSVHDDTIVISNDVTGGNSASYSFTTLNGAAHGDKIDFTDAFADSLLGGTTVAHAQVNVAGATTLAAALDLAANYSLLTRNPGTDASAGNGLLAANSGVIDWFQFGGDTYVVEAVNATNTAAAHTGLGANDYVVKITGLVDLGAAGSLAGSVLTA